jgi:hydrogenase expression/formation protein HypD
VFFAIGFETTAPAIAATLLEARSMGLDNVMAISALKVVPEALKALVTTPGLKLNGFLLPGHLSAITGTGIYDFLPRDYGTACVVAGFEPLDILQSILMLVEQVVEARPEVQIQYSRIVRREGNPRAREVLDELFEVTGSRWRGLGPIPGSGLKIRDEFSSLDALKRLSLELKESPEPAGCMCGEILKGLKKPPECPLFREQCTPQAPVGPCMVSSEGTCAAYYKYESLP